MNKTPANNVIFVLYSLEDMAHDLILGHKRSIFAYFGREHPTDGNQLDASLGMLNIFKVSNIQNGRYCSLKNFKGFISQLLSYIET